CAELPQFTSGSRSAGRMNNCLRFMRSPKMEYNFPAGFWKTRADCATRPGPASPPPPNREVRRIDAFAAEERLEFPHQRRFIGGQVARFADVLGQVEQLQPLRRT